MTDRVACQGRYGRRAGLSEPRALVVHEVVAGGYRLRLVIGGREHDVAHPDIHVAKYSEHHNTAVQLLE